MHGEQFERERLAAIQAEVAQLLPLFGEGGLLEGAFEGDDLVQEIESAAAEGKFFASEGEYGCFYDFFLELQDEVGREISTAEFGDRAEDLVLLKEQQDRLLRVGALLEAGPEYKKYAEEYEHVHALEFLRNLDLQEEEIRAPKWVVDVGAGSRFVAGYMIRHGINPDMRALEPRLELAPGDEARLRALWTDEVRAKVDAQTARASMHEPVYEEGSIDLFLLHFVFPGFDGNWIPEAKGDREQKQKELARRDVAALLRALSPEGEIRLATLLYTGKIWAEEIDRMQTEGLLQIEERVLMEDEEGGKAGVTILRHPKK